MKYLFVLLFLTGCSSAPRVVHNAYSCGVFDYSGTVYAGMTVLADSIEEAVKTTKTVGDRLLAKKLIPAFNVECIPNEDYVRGPNEPKY